MRKAIKEINQLLAANVGLCALINADESKVALKPLNTSKAFGPDKIYS